MQPISQKASGLLALQKYSIPIPIPQTAIILLAESDEVTIKGINLFIASLGIQKEYFVRPCPKVPNHGMDVGGYESQKVNKNDLLDTVLSMKHGMISSQTEADIIIMPWIEASMSSVIAPSLYAIIGRGHNGVTSGKGEQIILPMREEYINWLEKPSQVELEVVWDDIPKLVQVREAPEHIALASPPPFSVPGFVPCGSMEIRRTIHIAAGDLNSLGKIEADSLEDGTLVIQEQGSMLSHAAAHCRGAKIAFVIAPSEQFSVGKWITEIAPGYVVRGQHTTAVKPYSPLDYGEEFLGGIDEAREIWSEEWSKLGVFFHLYASHPMGDMKIASRMAGGYVTWLTVAGFMACVGEARHIFALTRVSDDRKQRVGGLLARLVCAPFCPPRSGDGRTMIYKEMSQKCYRWGDIAEIMEWIAKNCFRTGSWGGSYGGEKWAKCCDSIAALARAIIQRDVQAIVILANSLENAAHNGGWLFNKFVSKDDFDMATRGYSICYIQYAFKACEQAFRVVDNGLPKKPEAQLSQTIDLMNKGILRANQFDGNVEMFNHPEKYMVDSTLVLTPLEVQDV